MEVDVTICLIKLVRSFNIYISYLYHPYLIFVVLYHFSCIDVSFYFLVHCIFSHFQNGGRPLSWIYLFSQYLSKIQICSYFKVDMQNLVKRCAGCGLRTQICRDFGYDIQQIHGRVYFKRGVQPKCGVQNENCGVQD